MLATQGKRTTLLSGFVTWKVTSLFAGNADALQEDPYPAMVSRHVPLPLVAPNVVVKDKANKEVTYQMIMPVSRTFFVCFLIISAMDSLFQKIFNQVILSKKEKKVKGNYDTKEKRW
jgi:hypothetical protein